MKESLLTHLNSLVDTQNAILKLTLPNEAGFYSDLVSHPRVLRVVALSGGYSRGKANALLTQNPNLIASFSRALTEDLKFDQSQSEFDAELNSSIQSIFEASVK